MRQGSGNGGNGKSSYSDGSDDTGVGKDDAENGEQSFISAFFRQEWVQYGDAEVLFIKRAARAGDRWTSHVALPGGKRDEALDADDCATAVRETWEEVGLVLGKHSGCASEDIENGGSSNGKAETASTDVAAYYIGKLPERVVTTSWGKVPSVSLFSYLVSPIYHFVIHRMKRARSELIFCSLSIPISLQIFLYFHMQLVLS
jgi:8-oxo-dGTP pyrophosphatase MutT (NUDIX family)